MVIVLMVPAGMSAKRKKNQHKVFTTEQAMTQRQSQLVANSSLTAVRVNPRYRNSVKQ